MRRPALLIVLLSACGCGDDPPTPNDIGTRFAETLCAAKSRCCEAQGAPLSAMEMSNCRLAVAIVPFRGSPVATAQAQFNTDIAQQCLQAAARYDCSNGIQITDVCSFVFTGHTPLGQSCTQYTSCEQPSGGHAICENGICVAATFSQGVGAACPHGDLEECDVINGLWCKPAPTNPSGGVCAAPLKVGDPCDVIASCPAGTYCTAMAPSVCAPQVAIGAACDSGSYFPCQAPGDCMNGVCVAAGYCVARDPI
jgi:hypothetical protein